MTKDTALRCATALLFATAAVAQPAPRPPDGDPPPDPAPPEGDPPSEPPTPQPPGPINAR